MSAKKEKIHFVKAINKRAAKESTSNADVDTTKLFNQADAKWDRGNKKAAFLLFLKAAQLGEPSAQHNVGYFYHIGEGIKKNRKLALDWYKRAWRGDAQTDTCINIARVYASDGNIRQALYWWKRAVDAGDGDAALDLAKFYISSKRHGRAAEAVKLLKSVKLSDYATGVAIEEADTLLQQISGKKRK